MTSGNGVLTKIVLSTTGILVIFLGLVHVKIFRFLGHSHIVTFLFLDDSTFLRLYPGSLYFVLSKFRSLHFFHFFHFFLLTVCTLTPPSKTILSMTLICQDNVNTRF